MKPTLLAVLLTASAICRASTTYTVNETITLNSNAIASSGGYESFLLQFGVASPVTVQAGDVITGTFTFVNGPILLESSSSYNQSLNIFFSPTSGSPSLGATTSIDLLGVQGSYPGPNPFSVNGGGCCFAPEEYSVDTAADFSFTGFTYTIDVTSVSTGSASVYFSQFGVDAQTVQFGTAIPEPSSMMFCGIGFLALAWGAGRRRFRASF
jgi:hypothetical protein